jgi:hypothetical protein
MKYIILHKQTIYRCKNGQSRWTFCHTHHTPMHIDTALLFFFTSPITSHCLFQLTMDQKSAIVSRHSIYTSILASLVQKDPPPTPCYGYLLRGVSTRPCHHWSQKHTHAIPTHCSEKKDGRKLEVSTHTHTHNLFFLCHSGTESTNQATRGVGARRRATVSLLLQQQ